MAQKFKKAYVEISSICNLQCSFCPEVIRDKKLIETDLFREIVRQVAPFTELICFHLMGDPLVHPKLDELVQVCREFGARVFFVTNGVLLRPKQAEILLDPAFYQVNFSLHSFFDNHPDADPTEYLRKIFAYTDAALERRPDLYVNYRLWNLNDRRGLDRRNQDMLARIESHFGVSLNRNVDVKRHKGKHIKGRLYMHYDTEFVWPSLDLPILGERGTCYGLDSHFGVLVDGTVVPCCLDKEGQIPLGNIKEKPLEQILVSEKARTILRGFNENRLVEELCKRCNYIERFKENGRREGSLPAVLETCD